MPTITLDGGPHDPATVRSFMIFPNDPVMRNLYFFVADIEDACERAKENNIVRVEEDAATWRMALYWPNLKRLAEAIPESIKRGQVAGIVLAALYLMHRFSLPEPSMNKAIYFTQEFARANTYGDGSKIKVSERIIRNYWRQFRSVAHLWAAYRINNDPAYSFTKLDDLMTSGFVTFLEMAAEFYRFGCTFTPDRPKEEVPVLDQLESWALPDTLQPRTLTTDVFPDRLIGILENYKAPLSAM